MRNDLADWLKAVETYWLGLPPWSRSVLTGLGVLVVTALLAAVVRRIVHTKLWAMGLDEALRPPWSPPPERGEARGKLSPSGLLGVLAGLTVWALAACFAAWQFPASSAIGDQILRGLTSGWILVGVVLAALWLGRLVASQAIRLVQSSTLREPLEQWLTASESRHDTRTSALPAFIGCPVYVLVLLLTLLVAADLLGWTTLSNVLAAVWHAGLRFLIAGMALLIAWLGYRWAASTPPPQEEVERSRWHLQLGIIGGGAFLAVLLLSSSLGSLIAIAVLALPLMLLWLGRDAFPDILANLYLRSANTKEVNLPEGKAMIQSIGLLTTQLTRDDNHLALRNREVWAAALANAKNGVSSSVDPNPHPAPPEDRFLHQDR
jgi:MFS family permease